MNIALILSGGVGKRFAANLPKQYNLINGKPVIDYVIEACMKSRLTDRVIVVCDPTCKQFSKYLESGEIETVVNGKERYDSLNNGVEYIKEHYDCKNICILDAAAPLVYPELIDEYFSKLDEFECAITCRKITGELGNYHNDIFVRDDYYLMQSPEAFRFELITKHFRPDFYSSELVYQMPKETTRYLNFNFNHHIKITYDTDLVCAEALLNYFGNK